MLRRRDDWSDQIKRVQRRFQIAQRALALFSSQVGSDPTLLPKPLTVGELKSAEADLEPTYLIRLFAEFEEGLRDFWEATYATPIGTFDLIQSMAARRKVMDELTHSVHDVRKYRNHLVHQRAEKIEMIGIAQARRVLCTFFARLPANW
jgi:hypothetical protein